MYNTAVICSRLGCDMPRLSFIASLAAALPWSAQIDVDNPKIYLSIRSMHPLSHTPRIWEKVSPGPVPSEEPHTSNLGTCFNMTP